MLFDANRLNRNISHLYDTEDAAELAEILGRGYHVVVGNPPYIAVQDSALRDAYRIRYASCHMQFALTVPFMERFFELARVQDEAGHSQAGYVGKITSNSFMKREFGAPLVDSFLAAVDVTMMIDTSGAYIPGHGTPTVLIFARGRTSVSPWLVVIDGLQGEPRQPVDPAKGFVWTSIMHLVSSADGSSKYARRADVERGEFFRHPMTLGPGRDLLRSLNARAARRLGEDCRDAGAVAATREDGAYFFSSSEAATHGLQQNSVVVMSGDGVRDWYGRRDERSLFPYDASLDALETLPQPLLRKLLAKQDSPSPPQGLRWNDGRARIAVV